VVVIVLVGLLGLGAVHLGLAEVARARAQAAADAAALAGAAHDRAAAAQLAEADGAHLVEFQRLGTDVLVTVEVGDMRASARARAVRGPPPTVRG
jgi:type II secretory pathway pseudopilin PulG